MSLERVDSQNSLNNHYFNDLGTSTQEKCLAIASIVMPILGIVSTCLMVHFGFHPMGHNFLHIPIGIGGIKIPVSISTIAAGGCAITTFGLAVVLMNSDTVRKAWAKLLTINSLLFPRGFTEEEYEGATIVQRKIEELASNREFKETYKKSTMTPNEWIKVVISQIQDKNEQEKATVLLNALESACNSNPTEFAVFRVHSYRNFKDVKHTFDAFQNTLGLAWNAVDHFATVDEKTFAHVCEETVTEWTAIKVKDYNPQIVRYKSLDGAELGGYSFKQKNSNPNTPTIILIHGNASTSRQMIGLAKSYLVQGYNVFIPDFRGCGLNAGKGGRGVGYTFESGMFDMDAAYHYVKYGIGYSEDDIKNILNGKAPSYPESQCDNIKVHGYSLGGAFAAGLAAEKGIDVVLERTFDNPVHAVPVLKSPIMEPVRQFGLQVLKQKEGSDKAWDTKEHVKRVIEKGKKVVVIKGTDDETIPNESTDKIVSHNGSTKLITLNVDHNDKLDETVIEDVVQTFAAWDMDDSDYAINKQEDNDEDEDSLNLGND